MEYIVSWPADCTVCSRHFFIIFLLPYLLALTKSVARTLVQYKISVADPHWIQEDFLNADPCGSGSATLIVRMDKDNLKFLLLLFLYVV